MPNKVSMADIARQLGVSRATVSYVLNERESELISSVTRERILGAAREMGYRRNRAAQALAGQRSYLIELCVHGFYPAFYAYALEEFERHIAPTPYQLHIVKPNHWNAKKWEHYDGGWPVDGVIILDARLSDEALSIVEERGVPIVGTGIFPAARFDYVKVDMLEALLAAMRHLAAQTSRIVFVSAWNIEHAATSPDPRYMAYHRIMQEFNLQDEVIVAPDKNGLETRAATREIVRDYVQKKGCPDAIFCFNDERAIAALAALRDLNFRVPQDVKIIGCDGIEEMLYHNPTLSTIEYPIEETARLTWQFLQNRLENPDLPQQSATLTARLALRESSAF